MVNCNPKSTPADSNARLSAAMVPKSEGEKKKPSTEYRLVVGALLYLSTSTRPDISYSVSQVAKFCENPQPTHWNGVKRLLAWLGGKDEPVIGYTDADYAGDLDDSNQHPVTFSFTKVVLSPGDAPSKPVSLFPLPRVNTSLPRKRHRPLSGLIY
jgi:hypothetical protein